MADGEFGFFSVDRNEKHGVMNTSYYFGFEISLIDEIEDRLTELSKQAFSEIGLESAIDTLEIDYIDLDFETKYGTIYFIWGDGGHNIIDFTSNKEAGQDEIIYKDGKYKAMVFYSLSGWMPSGIENTVTDFLDALVKICPLNK